MGNRRSIYSVDRWYSSVGCLMWTCCKDCMFGKWTDLTGTGMVASITFKFQNLSRNPDHRLRSRSFRVSHEGEERALLWISFGMQKMWALLPWNAILLFVFSRSLPGRCRFEWLLWKQSSLPFSLQSNSFAPMLSHLPRSHGYARILSPMTRANGE